MNSSQPRKKCNGRHCRCMNVGNQCPNNHWATCAIHNPDFPEKCWRCRGKGTLFLATVEGNMDKPCLCQTPPQPQKQLSECEACDYSFNCYHTPQCETIDQCDTKSHKKHKKSCGSFDPADCKYGNWCVDCVTPESPKSSQLEITDILVDNKAHSEEFRNGVVWAMEEMAKKKQLPSQLTEEDREDEMTFEEAEKFLKIASGPDEWANELSEFHQNNIQSFKEDLIEKWLEAYDKIKSREAEEKVKAEYVLGLEAGMGDRKNMIDEAVKKERERCAKIADSMDLSNDVITDGKLGEFYNKAFRYACEKIKSEILNPEPPKE